MEHRWRFCWIITPFLIQLYKAKFVLEWQKLLNNNIFFKEWLVRASLLPTVQCSPVQPWWHSHFPSLQVPCSVQRGWHALRSHTEPAQPSSQRQLPPIHTPWEPQSTAHTSANTNKLKSHFLFGLRQNSRTIRSRLLAAHFFPFQKQGEQRLRSWEPSRQSYWL